MGPPADLADLNVGALPRPQIPEAPAAAGSGKYLGGNTAQRWLSVSARPTVGSVTLEVDGGWQEGRRRGRRSGAAPCPHP